MGRQQIVDVDSVLKSTNGGLDIFKREIPNFRHKTPINSPLRKDSTPSFSIFMSNGIAIYKDLSSGDTGNAITFIKNLYNTDFKGALDIITGKHIVTANLPVHSYTVESKQSKYAQIDFVDCRFTDTHKRYWDLARLDEEYLNSNDVFAVSKWAVNKKLQTFTKGEIVFGYVYKDELGNETGEVKILRIGKHISHEQKWRTNVPNHKLWRLHTLNPNKKHLFIVKSIKDALVLNKHFNINAIATQNEDPQILLENNYDYLESLPYEKVIAFGSDNQGWHSSLLITELTGWKYFNTPNNLYDKFKIEDPYDLVSKLNINTLEKLLLKKDLLD